MLHRDHLKRLTKTGPVFAIVGTVAYLGLLTILRFC